jgi:hypothetical protein
MDGIMFSVVYYHSVCVYVMITDWLILNYLTEFFIGTGSVATSGRRFDELEMLNAVTVACVRDWHSINLREMWNAMKNHSKSSRLPRPELKSVPLRYEA